MGLGKGLQLRHAVVADHQHRAVGGAYMGRQGIEKAAGRCHAQVGVLGSRQVEFGDQSHCLGQSGSDADRMQGGIHRRDLAAVVAAEQVAHLGRRLGQVLLIRLGADQEQRAIVRQAATALGLADEAGCEGLLATDVGTVVGHWITEGDHVDEVASLAHRVQVTRNPRGFEADAAQTGLLGNVFRRDATQGVTGDEDVLGAITLFGRRLDHLMGEVQ